MEKAQDSDTSDCDTENNEKKLINFDESENKVLTTDNNDDLLQNGKNDCILRKPKCNSHSNNTVQSESKQCDLECNTNFSELSEKKMEKVKNLLNSLSVNNIDDLLNGAISEYGLINDNLRRKIWPKLIGVDIFPTSPRPTEEEIQNHPYYQQVVLDVNRSLKRFPPSIEEKQRLAMQDQLVVLIMRVLVKHPELHYYQGYHDICVTFLLVLGEEMAFHVVNKLSLTHLNLFMQKSMEPTVEMMNYMFPIIEYQNKDLLKFLDKSDVGVIFALSWLITWFGHVLSNYNDVVRLFDFFIASNKWMPVYLSAAIVLHRSEEIMEQECDMACVHSLLCQIPEDLPFEDLVTESISLYQLCPPESLEKTVKLQMKRKKEGLKKKSAQHGIVHTVLKNVWNVVPSQKLTVSLVLAAAVLFSAVLYQAYKYKEVEHYTEP